MKLCAEIKMSMTLYHKQTMQKLNIDKVIRQEYDENSPEYHALCVNYREAIGFSRKGSEDQFDSALLKLLVEDSIKSNKEVIDNIVSAVKLCYKDKSTGWIEFGGVIINPNDFCAVQINEFKTNINKK